MARNHIDESSKWVRQIAAEHENLCNLEPPSFSRGSLGIQHVGKQFISKVLQRKGRAEEIQLRRRSNFFLSEPLSIQKQRRHTNAENQLFCQATIL